MYPNPQDALRLPRRHDPDELAALADELVAAHARAGHVAIGEWADRLVREAAADSSAGGRGAGEPRQDRLIELSARFAAETLAPADDPIAAARDVVARVFGFASWVPLVQHAAALAREGSAAAAFERTADAIVEGDLAGLERTLAVWPALVQTRSDRVHRATLLHYTSANGVEGYRQRTPPNVLDIARRLLAAGAEVDAEADVYGGGATTLMLVVTSALPRRAGVQDRLADLLLEHGARVPRGIVRDCLANGCPEAALHMAQIGAALSLEESAGLGHLDEVRRRLASGALASEEESTAALMMACWYDRREVVELLLESGVSAAARSSRDASTALHIAAFRGSPRLVDLLLRHGAPVNSRDDRYGTPPLVWALHAWLVEPRRSEARVHGAAAGNDDRYREVLHLLLAAGAEVEQAWLADERLRTSPELWAALQSAVR